MIFCPKFIRSYNSSKFLFCQNMLYHKYFFWRKFHSIERDVEAYSQCAHRMIFPWNLFKKKNIYIYIYIQASPQHVSPQHVVLNQECLRVDSRCSPTLEWPTPLPECRPTRCACLHRALSWEAPHLLGCVPWPSHNQVGDSYSQNLKTYKNCKKKTRKICLCVYMLQKLFKRNLKSHR